MRLVSYDAGGSVRAGVIEGDELIDAGESILDPRPGERVGLLADATVLAPIRRPGKIVCVGLNYQDHAAESRMAVPERPLLFAKFSTAVVGPGAAIRLPAITNEVDYEAELAVVIGRGGRGITRENALDHVFGYMCLNDVSARDIQLGDTQWTRGKSLDTFCPTGPWITTADEVADPQSLPIRCTVNGTILQDSNTSEMIFGVAELVSFISEAITLEPGDIIATGTPPGVGFVRTPPIFLRPGDRVAVEVGGLGVLENPVE